MAKANDERREKAVREHVLESLGGEIPRPISRLASLCTWDLYYGPISVPDDGKGWPGFSESLDILRTWIDKRVPTELYYDEEAELISPEDPTAWEEYYRNPETEEIGEEYYGPDLVYRLETRDVLGAIWDRELVSMVLR